MNRNVLIALIAVVVIAGGYYQFSYKPAQEAAEMAQKAADDAAATAKAAADDAAAAAKKAADDAAAAASTAATDTATAATTATGDAAALLDPAAWDATKVNAMIAASTLDDATKATLKGLVDAAGTDTVKIGEAITAIKTALKL